MMYLWVIAIIILSILFLLIFQVCSSASIAKKDVSNALADSNESHIENFRNNWKNIPGVKSDAVDNFINIFRKFQENSTDFEVIDGTVIIFLQNIHSEFIELNFSIRCSL